MENLQIGDKLYCMGYRGAIAQVIKIDRVTSKYAFANNSKFKREVRKNGFVTKVTSDSIWVVENDTLKNRLKRQNLEYVVGIKIEKLQLENLTFEKLEVLHEFLKTL